MVAQMLDLFETHLTVADLPRSMAFCGGILGLDLARAFPERKVSFYWIGGSGKGTGPLQIKLHLAFTVDLPDLLNAPARPRAAGATPRDFAGNATRAFDPIRRTTPSLAAGRWRITCPR
jgi:lactoylglutathione lyase